MNLLELASKRVESSSSNSRILTIMSDGIDSIMLVADDGPRTDGDGADDAIVRELVIMSAAFARFRKGRAQNTSQGSKQMDCLPQ